MDRWKPDKFTKCIHSSISIDQKLLQRKYCVSYKENKYKLLQAVKSLFNAPYFLPTAAILHSELLTFLLACLNFCLHAQRGCGGVSISTNQKLILVLSLFWVKYVSLSGFRSFRPKAHRFRDSSAQNHFGPGLLGPNRYFYRDFSARDSSAQYKILYL